MDKINEIFFLCVSRYVFLICTKENFISTIPTKISFYRLLLFIFPIIEPGFVFTTPRQRSFLPQGRRIASNICRVMFLA